MEKKYLVSLVFILGVLIGVGLGPVFMDKDRLGEKDTHIMSDGSMMKNMADMDMNSSMGGMMVGLSDKVGDEFDRAFLKLMIVHHEGAVLMSKQALEDAKHQEIKDLSNAIIVAQEKEIAMMKDWLMSWYK